MYSVSVIIPVKNGFPEIKNCINGILKQTIKVEHILVIDSGSTDDTLEFLRQINEVKLIQINPNDFNHGLTRNLGWKFCDSEFLLYTVQDAWASNEHWIEELLKGFVDDGVAAVCGQQIVPWDKDKNPLEWFRPISEPEIIRYQFNNPSDFNNLLPNEKKNICSWDDVTAMYRKSVLQQVPFQKVVFGEDMIWAKEVILKGYAIVYNYKARVYHYHLENAEFTFKRSFTTMYFRYKHFQFIHEKPRLSPYFKVKILKTLFFSLNFNLKDVLFWYNYNLSNYKANIKAYEVFCTSLKLGEDKLHQVHDQLCSKPPIPLKLK